ncbi:hypothetical protein VTK26DRAFT_7262 [Humicola hyalothermophila]
MSLDPEQDEDSYVSEEDADFAPDDVPADDSSVSDDEADDDDKISSGKRKRQEGDDSVEDAGFENSGDEAIIEKGKKRQKKAKRKDGAEADEDDGGEGGLIKTRRMRQAEKEERRAAAAAGPVTIDVDALWAQMAAQPVCRSAQDEAAPTQSTADAQKPSSQPQPDSTNTAEESDFIRIKRTYNFAGKVHTEEKLVARDSAEAKLYLAENGQDPASASDGPQKRMPRKAFRSAFEPVPADGTAGQQRADLNLGLSARLQAREQQAAKKLNTVEKSRMDWAGFVDREGIKDELELAGKSKHSFAARQEFLARSEALREEEARRARMAARV